MAKITIIGTSGAGKTVFISVLAERYSRIAAGQPYMEYCNPETRLYSAGVWSDLVDKQEWPASTPAGTLPALEWILRTPSGEAHKISVTDAPGQDIQAIYMPRQDGTDLSENQKNLKRNIDGADVLILLVNLCDIANAKNLAERVNFEVPIVTATKSAFARNARVAVLFSQHDQLRALLEQNGFNANDPTQAVREYIPGLAATITSAGHSAYVGFVAAVAETESFVDQTPTGDFITLSRPKKGFKSEGLAEVMNWITGTLHEKEETNANIPQKEDAQETERKNIFKKDSLKLSRREKKLVRAQDYKVGFIEASKRFFLRTFDFSGRATRAEYWKAMPIRFLILVLGGLIVEFLGGFFGEIFSGVIETEGGLAVYLSIFLILALVFDVAITLPAIALSVRRVHDCGKCAFWGLIPFVGVYLRSIIEAVLEFSTFSSFFAGFVPESAGSMFVMFPLFLAVGICGLYGTLLMAFRDSTVGENKYGDSEKYPIRNT